MHFIFSGWILYFKTNIIKYYLFTNPIELKLYKNWMKWQHLHNPNQHYTHTHTHTHIYIHTHTHTHTYIYIYIYIHTHRHTRTHARTHTHTYFGSRVSPNHATLKRADKEAYECSFLSLLWLLLFYEPENIISRLNNRQNWPRDSGLPEFSSISSTIFKNSTIYFWGI